MISRLSYSHFFSNIMLKNTSSRTQTQQYLYPIIGKNFNQDKNLIGLTEQNISLKLLPNLTVTGSLTKKEVDIETHCTHL